MNWRDIEDLCVVLFWFWEALQHTKLIIIIIIIIMYDQFSKSTWHF